MKLIKIGEVSKMLGVPISTIRDWCENGQLTAITNGNSKHRMFDPKQIVEFKKSRQKQVEKNYIEESKKMLKNRKEKNSLIKKHLEEFKKNFDLEFSEILKTHDKNVDYWFVIKKTNSSDSKSIFALRHVEDELFQYSTYPFANMENRSVFDGSVFLEHLIINDKKIHHVISGTLDDTMNALSKAVVSMLS
jgi:DNA-binding transcriptional MerR regulator